MELSKRHGDFEHSAGGVVFRRQANNIQILLIKDRNNIWSFPKGFIEKEEDIAETAKREVEEEAGISNLTVIDKIDSIRYFYRFQGKLIRKRVDFFLFEHTGNGSTKPQVEEGISEVKWFSPDESLDVIGYAKTNKPVLEKAIQQINKLTN